MSEKILNEILTVYKEQDLSKMLPIIEAKLEDEDCTALELCAAFLKQQMGEDAKDIPTEDYFAERKRIKMEERRSRRERVDRYRSERDSRRGGREDRRSESDGRHSRGDRRRENSSERSNRKNGRLDKTEFMQETSRNIKTLPSNYGKEKKKENKNY